MTSCCSGQGVGTVGLVYVCRKGWCSVGDSAGLNGIMLVWCLGVSRVGLMSGCWQGWSSVWVLAGLV